MNSALPTVEPQPSNQRLKTVTGGSHKSVRRRIVPAGRGSDPIKRIALMVTVLGFCGALRAEQARLTGPPTAVRRGNAVQIGFAVTAATDVEVAVLDKAGKVVRHLAAGMLGSNAPAPLAKGALKQELTWDGADDLGQPAVGGPFKVRVRCGVRPTFDRLIGYNPGGLGSVRALATGPDGTLYVWQTFGDIHPGDGTTVCVAFDRTGRYLRQVMPYPANLPEEKLGGLRRLTVEGTRIPFIYQAETRSLIPGLGDLSLQRPVVARDGRIAFVGVQEWLRQILRYNRGGIAQVVVLQSDGSAPRGVLRTVLEDRSRTGANLALSPDEATLYATGLTEGTLGRCGVPFKHYHAVYKFGWDDAAPTIFVGDAAQSGDGEKLLNTPVTVATDKNGNVYVADWGNNRVAVFRPDGSFLGQINVEHPYQVAVHPKTGAIYVLGGKRCNVLSKFASVNQAQPVNQTKTPFFDHKNYRAVMALDGSADPAVVWVASGSDWAGFTLMRYEDLGTEFSPGVDIAKSPHNSLPNAGPRTSHRLRTGGAISGMALDRVNRRLYLNRGVVDLDSGKWSSGTLMTDGTKCGVGAFGLDGKLYSQRWPSRLSRAGADLKPLPFDTVKGGEISISNTSYRLRGRGVTADARGNVYVLSQKPPELRQAGDASDANNLFLFGPDGKLINDRLIDSEIRQLDSVRLDAAGNIYLAIGVRPAGKTVPDAFAGLDLGQPWKVRMNSLDLNWYTLMYGSIVKFSPRGGVIRKGVGGAPVDYSFDRKTEIKGAEWMFFGASPVLSWRSPFPDSCLCESPRFDVDGYGRSFFPDAARFRVGMLDTAGNLIGWFGSYGNQDSAGPGSAIPTPEIAFYWPFEIAVGDDIVYVGDRLNRRVVAVRLNWADERSTIIKDS